MLAFLSDLLCEQQLWWYGGMILALRPTTFFILRLCVYYVVPKGSQTVHYGLLGLRSTAKFFRGSLDISELN